MVKIESKLRKWLVINPFRSKKEKNSESSVNRIAISMPLSNEKIDSQFKLSESEMIDRQKCNQYNISIQNKHITPILSTRICSTGKVSIVSESTNFRNSIQANECDDVDFDLEMNIEKSTSCMRWSAAQSQKNSNHNSSTLMTASQYPESELLVPISITGKRSSTDFTSFNESREDWNETECFSIGNVDIETYQTYCGLENSHDRKRVRLTNNANTFTPLANPRSSSIRTSAHSILQSKDTYGVQLYRSEMLHLIQEQKLTFARQNSEILHLKQLLAQERRINAILATPRSRQTPPTSPNASEPDISVESDQPKIPPKTLRNRFIPIEITTVDIPEQDLAPKKDFKQFNLLPPYVHREKSVTTEDNESSNSQDSSGTGFGSYRSASNDTISTSVFCVETKNIL
ncbi:hypothetical protein CLIB1423_09S01112 [[Candida] railenensis]|uniref:Uncharacterized protein n=1 Tax=[Candida] railenensis TaxID=45579 RepID=A0A9P0QQE2_9ASCO|nr:hypothetical protein CLIB1423_09S01112 [[Candida] railenensis]